MVAIARSGALFHIVLAAMILWPNLAHAGHEPEAPPHAQDEPAALPAAVYFSLRGGWALMHDSEFGPYDPFDTLEPDAEAAFDSAATWGGAIGYRTGGGWRFEFEVTHRSHAFDDVQWNLFGKFGNFRTSGKLDSLAYMVNAIGEFSPMGNYQVFMGLGVGAAHFELKNVSDSDGALFSDSDTYIAGQFLIGVEYALTENVAMSFSYKYFGSLFTTHADPGQPNIGGELIRIPVDSSSFLLGVSYYF